MFKQSPSKVNDLPGGDYMASRLKPSLISTPERAALPDQGKEQDPPGKDDSGEGLPTPAGGPQQTEAGVIEGEASVASLSGHAALAHRPFSRAGSDAAAASPLGRGVSRGSGAVTSAGGARPSSQAARIRSTVFMLPPGSLGDDERLGTAGTGSGSGGRGSSGRMLDRGYSIRSQKSTQIEVVADDLVKKFDKQLKVGRRGTGRRGVGDRSGAQGQASKGLGAGAGFKPLGTWTGIRGIFVVALTSGVPSTIQDNWGLETLVAVGESWLPSMLEQDAAGQATDIPVLKLFEVGVRGLGPVFRVWAEGAITDILVLKLFEVGGIQIQDW